MKKIIYILYLVFAFICGASQSEYKKDMLEVCKHMEKAKTYSVNLKYSLFLDQKLNQAYQTRLVHLNFNADKINLIQEQDLEVIETELAMVNINHHEKRIYYTKYLIDKESNKESVNKQEMDDMYKLISDQFDSLKQYIEKINLVSNKGGIKEYEVFYNEGEYTSVRVGVNMKKKILTYILINFSEPQKIRPEDEKPRKFSIRLDYLNYDLNPVFNANTFNVSKAIVDKKDKIYLTQKFKNYKLIIL